ncbi:hypothetical protein L1047_09610 [Synechococcus sp. Nb3U1]|uniref:hypothetical protein n=1 Tax=Synechococcus sp. Nb3U1 TaxID=1914529 RepID=UPI001F317F83|nr:hypothetical protein [Synechococcus sp. Nb3U1]MCF2971449.1 hypothetical protein [Synechococcus sp. Nb3U1]
MSEALQHHFERLESQVQELKAAIERMPEQLVAVLLAAQDAKRSSPTPSRYSVLTSDLVEDGSHSFLLDEEMPTVSSRSMGHDIAPEAQVQRLSAQLTAAYNRIAALEEQLLAQRLQH